MRARQRKEENPHLLLRSDERDMEICCPHYDHAESQPIFDGLLKTGDMDRDVVCCLSRFTQFHSIITLIALHLNSFWFCSFSMDDFSWPTCDVCPSHTSLPSNCALMPCMRLGGR